MPIEPTDSIPEKKRKSGIPTGNAGEYFVMGELLRRGYDAQLADRNTKGYDLLVGHTDATMKRIQVKTVRSPPWYVNQASFAGALAGQVTVYVLIGSEIASKPIRYFIAKNSDLADQVHIPSGWESNGLLNLKAVQNYENRWPNILDGAV